MTAVNSELSDALNEFNRERLEAIAQLERSLHEGTSDPFEIWLEARLSRDSIAYPLLLDLQEWLNHRLLTLRRLEIDGEPAPPAIIERQIALVTYLHGLVKDWMRAILLKSLRKQWNESQSEKSQ